MRLVYYIARAVAFYILGDVALWEGMRQARSTVKDYSRTNDYTREK